MTGKVIKRGRSFLGNNKGAVSLPFAFSIIPIVASIGAAVDLGRGLIVSANVQSAVDQAALTVANIAGTDEARKGQADVVLAAALQGLTTNTTFRSNADGTVTYNATAVMQTMFTPFISPTVSITRSATARATIAATEGKAAIAAVAGWSDDSCILTLGEDMDLDSDNIMTWNGSPSVQLTGCSLRSNRSMKCNGGSTGALASYAHGTVTGACPNPQPGQVKVPDIYAAYQTSVTPLCGAVKTGYTWTATTSLPAASTVVKYPATANPDYNEVHICGTLTLSGIRQLVANASSGTEPDKDTLIVVENGGIVLADDAQITAKRVTFILAGKNSTATDTANPVITWPNGSGNSASLISTPTVHENNPFRGFSVYQDPDNNFDQTWKPGANARFDGILYLPKAKLTLSGNMIYGAKECLKVVVGQFTLNGNVSLSMKQNATACTAIKVRPYTVEAIAAVDAVAGTEGASSRLVR